MAVVIIGGTTSPAASPDAAQTLLELRLRLADEIGFLQSTVVTDAAAGDPARFVVADELEDDEGGHAMLTRPWLYARTGEQAGTQRRLIDHPSGWLGPLGALAVSRPFAAPLAPATVIDVTSPLPVKTHLGIRGLDACIAEGLSKIWVEAILPMTGAGYRHDLSAYPLAVGDQLVGLYDVSGAAGYGPTMSPWDGFRLIDDPLGASGASSSGLLVTERSYPAGQAFGLGVLVRADRLIWTGAAWELVPGGGGPTADADAVACPPGWAVTFGAVRALLFLRRWIGTRPDLGADERKAWLAEVAARLAAKAASAKAIAMFEMPRPAPERQRPLAVSGPSSTWP